MTFSCNCSYKNYTIILYLIVTCVISSILLVMFVHLPCLWLFIYAFVFKSIKCPFYMCVQSKEVGQSSQLVPSMIFCGRTSHPLLVVNPLVWDDEILTKDVNYLCKRMNWVYNHLGNAPCHSRFLLKAFSVSVSHRIPIGIQKVFFGQNTSAVAC